MAKSKKQQSEALMRGLIVAGAAVALVPATIATAKGAGIVYDRAGKMAGHGVTGAVAIVATGLAFYGASEGWPPWATMSALVVAGAAAIVLAQRWGWLKATATPMVTLGEPEVIDSVEAVQLMEAREQAVSRSRARLQAVSGARSSHVAAVPGLHASTPGVVLF